MSAGLRELRVPHVTPVWVGEHDYASSYPSIVDQPDPNGDPYRRARILVRHRGEPVGFVDLPVTDDEVAAAVINLEAERLYGPLLSAIDRAAAGETLQSLDESNSVDAPSISVVIGTRNRPQHVIDCVDRLIDQNYSSPFEVIVVENGATDDTTQRLLAELYGSDDRVRFISEPEPGLSRARNIGLVAARYPITAFLSDDIRVGRDWLAAVARGFARSPRVKAVTGFCPPVYLDTQTQQRFEARMAWGTRFGFEPVIHTLEDPDDPLHPYRPGTFANGSNMAFETDYFRSVGGFDEILGPGTLCKGGEDLDSPVRLLVEGHAIAFEPAAVGWHADRQDERPSHKNMYAYGLGLTAFLTKHMLRADTRPVLLRRMLHGIGPLVAFSEQNDPQLGPNVERGHRDDFYHLLGRLAGPFIYFQSITAGIRRPAPSKPRRLTEEAETIGTPPIVTGEK